MSSSIHSPHRCWRSFSSAALASRLARFRSLSSSLRASSALASRFCWGSFSQLCTSLDFCSISASRGRSEPSSTASAGAGASAGASASTGAAAAFPAGFLPMSSSMAAGISRAIRAAIGSSWAPLASSSTPSFSRSPMALTSYLSFEKNLSAWAFSSAIEPLVISSITLPPFRRLSALRPAERNALRSVRISVSTRMARSAFSSCLFTTSSLPNRSTWSALVATALVASP